MWPFQASMMGVNGAIQGSLPGCQPAGPASPRVWAPGFSPLGHSQKPVNMGLFLSPQEKRYETLSGPLTPVAATLFLCFPC